MNAASRTLLHPALAPAEGAAPGKADLTDRKRLGVLLQGVALMAHAETAGLWIAAPWSMARLTAAGRLAGVPVSPGTDVDLPQRRASELLLEVFAADRSVAGRGEARSVARRLLELWEQDVEPVAPSRLVEQLLAASPFLWDDEFAEDRTALAAVIDGELFVAGPGGARRRLLEGAPDLEAVQSRLAGTEARALWVGTDRRSPVAWVEEGRWYRALLAWDRRPPENAAQRFHHARALYAVGRFESAKRELKGLRSIAARVLRLGCQSRLGELEAVKRALARWAEALPEGEPRVDLVAIAIRLHANLGEAEKAAGWIEPALRTIRGRWRQRLRLLAAEWCWDRGDARGMECYLAEFDGGEIDDDLRWRRHHVGALAALQQGEGRRAVRRLESALAMRRALRPFEAAGIWNDLALARAQTGDLGGAQRALSHVVRLSGYARGSRRTTLALCNLAEVRLRRGQVAGGREIALRSLSTNERTGNWRAWTEDRALLARFELVQGRPGRAVEWIEETRERLEEVGAPAEAASLAVLEARARGWLGEPEEAAAALDGWLEAVAEVLEPEELPALLALAGRVEEAKEAAQRTDQGLWSSLLAAEGTSCDWSRLEDLEPYRAARLLFDVHRLGLEPPPAAAAARAARVLEQVGAVAWAAELLGRDEAALEATTRYLESSGPWQERLGALAEVLAPDARVSWRDDEREIVLVDGPGGGQVLEESCHGGRARVASPWAGVAERLLVAVTARDLPQNLVAAPRRDAGRSRHRSAILGTSTVLTAALERLDLLAGRELPVLILGETGTGKELAARRLHGASSRSSGPFVAVNCAELSENLLVSELFGHVRGAFTGADRDRAGIFETAAGGVVFLDEIGDLPLTAQGKLLRVLQEREVRRVGESAARPVDTRVVAATHRDLERRVAERTFRQDLWFRLGAGVVTLPPLRERGEDLFILAEHFLAEETVAGGLTAEARRALGAHNWPGNVRELRNVLAVAAALSRGETIEVEHLGLAPAPATPGGGYHEQVEALRRRLVREALQRASGNQAAAARDLGLSRQAMSYLVRQLDIAPES